MPMELSAVAFFSSTKLDLNSILAEGGFGELEKRENGFLLFRYADTSYVYIKDYGSLVGIGLKKEEAESLKKKLAHSFDANWTEYEDDIVINVGHTNSYVQFGQLHVHSINIDIIHIVSLNLAQSVALFYYQSLSDVALDKTRLYTNELESKGKISLTRKN